MDTLTIFPRCLCENIRRKIKFPLVSTARVPPTDSFPSKPPAVPKRRREDTLLAEHANSKGVVYNNSKTTAKGSQRRPNFNQNQSQAQIRWRCAFPAETACLRPPICGLLPWREALTQCSRGAVDVPVYGVDGDTDKHDKCENEETPVGCGVLGINVWKEIVGCGCAVAAVAVWDFDVRNGCRDRGGGAGR
ncbi:unnamed protein product [Phytophthora lilii]|uniref:Unnamed protein product n=1 Tax=Phytophthora lilii TaxID=2077276 RepID=A0A9W6XNJ9_9STRA|nr:unnamed protein product [Phytophthora lilii]